MPTVQQGPRGTIDLSNDLIVQEMMAKVAQLEPSARPITTLMNGLEKALPTDQPEPQHAEDELFPNIDLSAGTSTPADLTIDVQNPLFYLVGDIIHVPRTGENMRVTTAPGTSPVTVVRGVGSAPANIVNNEPLWILGGAQAEGDNSRTAVNTLETPYTHFCQIIRNAIDGTGTQIATRQHGGDFDDQAEKKVIEHKRQCEYFFKWGTPSRTNTGEWLRTMEGLNHRIQTNRIAVDGTLGEGEWDAVLEVAFQYGNSRKLALCSPRATQAINNFSKGKLVTVPSDESYGLAIREYTSPFGDVWLVNDRELKGAVYGGYIMILDMDYLIVRYLRAGPDGRRSEKYQGDLYYKRIENIQANDSDTRKDELFSELTFQMIHERTMAVATGING